MKLSIAQKLQGMLIASIVTLCVVGAAGIYSALSTRNALVHVHSETIPAMKAFAQIQRLVGVLNNTGIYRGITTRAETVEEKDQLIADLEKKLHSEFDFYEKNHASTSIDKQLLVADRKALDAYLVAMRNVFSQSRSYSKDLTINRLQGEVEPLGLALQQALDKHVEYLTNQAQRVEHSSSAGSTIALSVTLILTLLGSLLVGGGGYVLTRSIARSLTEIQHGISKIESELDFTHRVKVISRDDFGNTCEAFNRLIGKIQDNLVTLSQGAVSVATAADAMANISSNVDTSASLQSRSAQDMAVTVKKVAASIEHVTERAKDADQISRSSEQLAGSGELVIGQMVDSIQNISSTMHSAADQIHELEEHTDKILAVVTVIKDVADQTNLLALNAAIEAARAGEQGRGFAVVADEVRKLAERTSASTREIAMTVNAVRTSAGNVINFMRDTGEKVSISMAHAHEASGAIHQIGDSSRESVSMVGEISMAIREQDVATKNIAEHIGRIATMAQDSSVAAHESAASAKELAQLANQMQQIVVAYRL